MAIYKCNVCGAIYDEEKEGRPISELSECPVCHQPVSRFELIPEENIKSNAENMQKTDSGALDYDSATARYDKSSRYMAEIHEMAVTGNYISAAMSTKMG